MAKTVAGLFENFSDARAVVKALVDSGFDRNNISLVANGDPPCPECSELLVGVGTLAIPEIGTVLAAGPMAAALKTIAAGTAAGGLISSLVDMGVPNRDANSYTEGVRRGGTLVTVTAPDDMAKRANDIQQRHGAARLRDAS